MANVDAERGTGGVAGRPANGSIRRISRTEGVLAAVAAIAVPTSSAVRAAEQTVTLDVGNMFCAGCTYIVRGALAVGSCLVGVLLGLIHQNAALRLAGAGNDGSRETGVREPQR